jgi:cytochrome d ubiquinol oxidase subunit I
MIGLGAVTALLALVGLWLIRRGRVPESTWFYRIALWTIPFPLLANSVGWIFTEMGRQPWVVYSQMFTRDGVSPLVGPGLVATSLIVSILLYLVLAVVEVRLLMRYAKAGPPEEEPSEAEPPSGEPGEPAERPMSFAY